MATLLCSICGQQPEVPVVSPASGKIFEKRLIVKYIEENGTDPVTGGKLEIFSGSKSCLLLVRKSFLGPQMFVHKSCP
uniref:Pre-mRNA-processing factor 19 n=1 Tax=Meloidogyne incognita TaxID=6306 RepID=A0A914P564_MELIC